VGGEVKSEGRWEKTTTQSGGLNEEVIDGDCGFGGGPGYTSDYGPGIESRGPEEKIGGCGACQ
jgi:hypothetical protein